MSGSSFTGRVVSLAVVALALLAGCQHPPDRPPGRTTTTSTRPIGGPPSATVQGDSTTVRLPGFGCFDRLCVDPAPLEILRETAPDVGTADEVTVTISSPGWNLGASFLAPGDQFGQGRPGVVTRTGPTSWRVTPPEEPAAYLVLLNGSHPAGDALFVFRWTVA
jgi:hypothetical protein